MVVKYTERQLIFWRALMAPFAKSELSEVPGKGKSGPLTYVDKRALANRLDSVCGPDGWWPEYRPTERGYTCRLTILCPGRGVDDWNAVSKEDGGAFTGMGGYKKEWNSETRQNVTTEQWEEDTQNDEKSGYTQAFRRAAQDAWGIARYLYKKGIPAFMEPNARPVDPIHFIEHPPTDSLMATGAPNPGIPNPVASVPVKPITPATITTTIEPTPPAARQPDPPPKAPAIAPICLPVGGKQLYPWAKEMEKVFETTIISGMATFGEAQGWGRLFAEWNQLQVNAAALDAIQKCLREMPTYKGQFEHLFPGGVPDPKIPVQKGVKPDTQPTPVGVNIADLRKALVERMKLFLSEQLHLPQGQVPEVSLVKQLFLQVVANSPNAAGNLGEIPESLSKMMDATWVGNCIKFVDAEIANLRKPPVAVTEGAVEDDIPF